MASLQMVTSHFLKHYAVVLLSKNIPGELPGNLTVLIPEYILFIEYVLLYLL